MMMLWHKSIIGKITFGLLCLIAALWSAEVFAQSASNSFTVGLQVGDDTEAPSVPTNVTATPIAETQVDVTWSTATDNFGVVGYQVFRDGVQITTTAATSFSDTGLAASTTYSYTLRAFDSAGNVSSSTAPVATTTFATPPPPATTTTSSNDSSTSGSRLPLAELEALEITSGTKAAEITFTASLPIRYILRYGTAEALTGGIVETIIYRENHTAVLQDLQSGTTYFYELYATDRFGREVVLQRATFTTAAEQSDSLITNLEYFVGDMIDDDVILRWRMPDTAEVAFVRIVRSEQFFPQSPTDGVVVYEGSDTAYADIGALRDTERQFYTLFAYSLSGVWSSGRVLQMERVPQPTSVVNPDTEDSVTVIERPVPTTATSSIPGAALSVRQAGRTFQLDDRRFTIEGDIPYGLYVDMNMLPNFTRSVLVTVFQTDQPEQFFTYILRRNRESGLYEARLPGLPGDSEYSFIVRAYSMSGTLIDRFEGGIVLQAPRVTPVQNEPLWQLSLGYVLVGILMGVLLVGIIAYLLRVLFRQPQRL